MSKFLASLCVVLSLFTFVSVNGQETYAIPDLVIPIASLNVMLYGSGIQYDVNNLTRPLGQNPYVRYSTQYSKIGSYVSFSAYPYSHPEYMNLTDIPFGIHIYRDDAKKLVVYPPVGTGFNNAIYRCEDKGASTTDATVKKFMDYIDPAHAVRGKSIFTSKIEESYSGYDIVIYSYNEEKDISGSDDYDKVMITHSYVIENSTKVCMEATHNYRRHIKGGDYEPGNYASNDFYIYFDDIRVFQTDEDLLAANYEETVGSDFEYNGIESLFSPNVVAHDSGYAMVCPEIDFLPRPLLVNFLTSNNYTEYELVLDNPVSVGQLTDDTATILNLTSSNEDYIKVSFDGINKIGKQWSVDLVMPTKVGEALAAAIENGDIKKSELAVISKVKKMNKKN